MIEMNRRQATTALLAGVALPKAALAQGGTPQARVTALYDRLFETFINASPESATGLGIDTGARAGLRSKLSDSAYDQRFVSSKALADAAPEIRAIDARALDPAERTRLATLAWHAERRAEAIRAPYGGTGYLPYVISQRAGSYAEVPDFLDSRHPVATEADAAAWLARMEMMASNIRHEVARARADAGRGVIPPDFVIDKTLAQTRTLRAQSGVASGMAASLQRKATAAGLGAGWDVRAAKIVDGPIAAALDAQIALLTELKPRSTGMVGMSNLPGGREYYAAALRSHTSTSLTPAEAHRVGLAEVADYEARLEPLLRAQGLTSGSVGARIAKLGEKPDQLWPNTDAGRAELLAFANARQDAIRPLLPKAFIDPPEARLEIRRVPPAIELGAARGYAQRGSLDGKRPPAFYINLRDTGIWPRFSVPTLVYHEGLPGHVFQGAVLQGTGELPLLFRASLGIAAYSEGWGLYAEQVADELGVYDDEPLGRIGYLQAALYRAVRVVVDTGMHALGWSRAKAAAYMVDKTGLAAGAVANEIDRYVVTPAQATSYKLGHSEIVRAREAAKSRLGSRFDVRAFHKFVLAGGAVPLDVLRRNVAAWDGSA